MKTLTKLNPHFFNSRGFIYQKQFLTILKTTLQKYDWGINEDDISDLYIFGEQITGHYKQTSPLKVGIYFQDVVINQKQLNQILNIIQASFTKYAFYRNANLEIFYQDINHEKIVFDIRSNQIMTNKVKEQKDEPKKTQILLEVPSKKSSRKKQASSDQPQLIAKPIDFSTLDVIKAEGKKILTYTEMMIKDDLSRLTKRIK